MRLTKKQKKGVQMEDLDSKLDLLLENQLELLKLKPTVEKIDTRLERVENDLISIKVGQKKINEDVDRRLTKVEGKVAHL